MSDVSSALMIAFCCLKERGVINHDTMSKERRGGIVIRGRRWNNVSFLKADHGNKSKINDATKI